MTVPDSGCGRSLRVRRIVNITASPRPLSDRCGYYPHTIRRAPMGYLAFALIDSIYSNGRDAELKRRLTPQRRESYVDIYLRPSHISPAVSRSVTGSRLARACGRDITRRAGGKRTHVRVVCAEYGTKSAGATRFGRLFVLSGLSDGGDTSSVSSDITEQRIRAMSSCDTLAVVLDTRVHPIEHRLWRVCVAGWLAISVLGDDHLRLQLWMRRHAGMCYRNPARVGSRVNRYPGVAAVILRQHPIVSADRNALC